MILAELYPQRCYHLSGELCARGVKMICLAFTALSGGIGPWQDRSKIMLGSRRYGAHNGRTVHGAQNDKGIKYRQKKKRLPLSLHRPLRKPSKRYSEYVWFDSVRISSNLRARLKAEYRGGKAAIFASTVFSGFPSPFLFLIYDFPFLSFGDVGLWFGNHWGVKS